MAQAGASAGFTKPELNASPCNFSFKLPSFTFGFTLKLPGFPPPIPIPRFRLALSCDLSKPIDVSAGLDYGGGRTSNSLPSPDDDDSF
jgi:hypothetical protein